jgi:chromosome segregation ATPase
MPDDPNNTTDSPAIEPPAEPAPVSDQAPAAPGPETALETPAPEEPRAPSALAEFLGEFWARLRNAFRGFARGLRGLPVSVEAGEEGTVPVVEAEAARRKIEKKLDKAQVRIVKLEDELKDRKQVIRDGETRLRDLQRDLKTTQDQAARMEATVLRDLEQTRQAGRNRDEQIEDLRKKLSDVADQRDQGRAELEDVRRQLQNAAQQAEQVRTALQQQLDELNRQIEQRDREIGHLSRERDERQTRIMELTSELIQAREQTKQATEEAERQQEEMRREISARAESLSARERERDELRQQLAEREGSLAESQAQLDAARKETEELRTEVKRWQDAAAEKESALDQTQQHLKLTAKQKEKEIAKVAEQTDYVRSELREAKREAGELKKQLEAVEDFRREHDQVLRGGRVQEARLNALQEEFQHLESRSHETENILRELYSGVVNPLTIAMASVDLLPVNKMQADDAETVADLRRNLNDVRSAISTLVAKMSELGIPTEKPAQARPAAKAPGGKPPDPSR